MKPAYRRMVRVLREKEASAPPHADGCPWWLYILRCADDTFYTGVTTDPPRRLDEHNRGHASRYTRARRPVAMVYLERCGSRGWALSRECAVKAMPRPRKERLAGGGGE